MPFNNEIEKVKAEIKVLEKKLSFLEELEQTKSPVEEAYKRWMDVYPPTGPSVDGIDDIRWRAFQMGYNAAYAEKVAPPEEEPKTLYQLIEDWWSDIFCANSMDDMETCIDGLVDQIEMWLPKEQSAEGSQNAYVESAVEGFNDCLTQIRGKLR